MCGWRVTDTVSAAARRVPAVNGGGGGGGGGGVEPAEELLLDLLDLLAVDEFFMCKAGAGVTADVLVAVVAFAIIGLLNVLFMR